MIGYRRFALVVEKALKLSANTGDKIINYGDGNLYPQEIAELIYASKTAIEIASTIEGICPPILGLCNTTVESILLIS